MKRKVDQAKLSFNKSTVSNLTSQHMTSVKGGLLWTDPRACDTDYTCSDFTWAICGTEVRSNSPLGCCEVLEP